MLELLGESVELLNTVVDAMDSEQIEHSEWILLQQNQVLLRDVPSRAQEVLHLLVEDFGRETIDSSLHVSLGSTPDCFKHAQVLLPVAVDVMFPGCLLDHYFSHGSLSLPVLSLFCSLSLISGL